MTAPSSRARPALTLECASTVAASVLLVALAVAHHGSLQTPFVFDDFPAIRDNPTIRTLWPGTSFSPPNNTGLGGRPLANFSFALSYAFGGGALWAHHAINLALHASSALLLFGILRRTLASARIALGAALVWAIHPLTTAAVTYLSQRTELLMAFCLLLTLYCFVRGWLVASVAACACGMMSKENMAAAPLVVWLFDRTFFAGSFRGALRQRRGFYIALAATWLVLGYLLTTRLHQRSLGFGLGVSPLEYALTECRAVILYAKLAVWPSPLVFDYGRDYTSNITTTTMCALILAGALVATLWALRRRSALGFAAACVFLLLAPSSSFVPVAETPIAENRMYLPLAVLVASAIVAIHAQIRRCRSFGDLRASSASVRLPDGARRVPSTLLLIAAALALIALTVVRNHDYRSESALWTDTVAKRPQNARAHFNRGVALLDAGRAADAAPAFMRALELNPAEAKAHNSLGNALLELGRPAEAVPHFANAVALEPNYPRAWFNYGTALFRTGRSADAIARFERARRLDPKLADAENALGNAYFQREEPARAIPHYEAALRLDPALADAHYNCGSANLELGRIDQAIAHFAAAARLKPADAEIRNNLGAALVRAGRFADAVAEFEAALRLKPDYGDARDNLALTRAELSREGAGPEGTKPRR